MSLNGMIALVCFLGFFSCQIWSLILHHKLIETINSKRPPEEQLDLFGFFPHPMSFWKVCSIYRALCPQGGLLRLFWIVTVAGNACMVAAAVFLFRS
jgi:hypothetical protein